MGRELRKSARLASHSHERAHVVLLDLAIMTFIRKRWRKLLAISLPIATLVVVGIICWAGAEIASPSRRALMDYHREYLDHPATHGLTIGKFTASDGTPCLVCTPAPSGTLAERGALIRQQLTARGLTLEAPGKIIGTLVLLHGRKGRKEDYLPIAERLCAAGFRCIIPDLPAHGDHPTNIATYGVREAGLPERILGEASRKFSFNPHPAGLIGMSMGGSVAMHASGLPNSPWNALAVICSFDSFPAVIEGQASRHLGTTLGRCWAAGAGTIYHMISGVHLADIQPGSHAPRLTIPTLVAHGPDDRIIAISSGQRLFDSLPSSISKKWVEVPAAGHDNILITSYPIYADIAEWMLRNVK